MPSFLVSVAPIPTPHRSADMQASLVLSKAGTLAFRGQSGDLTDGGDVIGSLRPVDVDALRAAFVEACDLADGEAVDACGVLLVAVASFLGETVPA